MRHFRTTLFPLFLMATTPLALVVFWQTCTFHQGSLWDFFAHFDLAQVIARWPLPSWTAVKIIGIFAALEAALMVGLPGPLYQGPVTPTGNRPTYKLNGVLAWVVTHVVLGVAAYPLHLFSPSLIYDHFGEVLTTLTLFALLFCVFLYFKGSYAPSSSDAGRSGNPVWDFYWGVELHPQLGSFNLKQYANCRLGMMGWSVLVFAWAAKQAEAGTLSHAMIASVTVQIVYIVKFFWWESGYFGSLDIMHDRFGYYIAWGVLAWVPGVYTLTGFYLVNQPIENDVPVAYAAACVVLGVLAIWANYDADAQRQRVRLTEGKTTVWGKPPETMTAKYTTTDGKQRESLLLLSGWWGLARHFHYVPEITLSLAWSLPAGFHHFVPYFYVVFLTILLVDRAGRDEKRCAAKYGADWDKYKARVPWRILPGVY